MDFQEYQNNALKTDAINRIDSDCVYYLLGLAGETGEVIEKFKKIFRNKDGIMSSEDKKEIAKELGDVLWYLTMIGHYSGYDLSEIAKMNNEKTLSRLERGKIKSEGDNR